MEDPQGTAEKSSTTDIHSTLTDLLGRSKQLRRLDPVEAAYLAAQAVAEAERALMDDAISFRRDETGVLRQRVSVGAESLIGSATFAGEIFEELARDAPGLLLVAADYYETAATSERASQALRERAARCVERFEERLAGLTGDQLEEALLFKLRRELDLGNALRPDERLRVRLDGFAFDPPGPTWEETCVRAAIVMTARMSGARKSFQIPQRFSVGERSTDSARVMALMEWAYGAPFVPVTVDDICRTMRAAGDGSRGIVVAQHVVFDRGHVANVTCHDGRVFEVDGSLNNAGVLSDDEVVPDAVLKLLVTHQPSRSVLQVDAEKLAVELLRILDSADYVNAKEVPPPATSFGPVPRAVAVAMRKEVVGGFQRAPWMAQAAMTARALSAVVRSHSDRSDDPQRSHRRIFDTLGLSHRSVISGESGFLRTLPPRNVVLCVDSTGQHSLFANVDGFPLTVDPHGKRRIRPGYPDDGGALQLLDLSEDLDHGAVRERIARELNTSVGELQSAVAAPVTRGAWPSII